MTSKARGRPTNSFVFSTAVLKFQQTCEKMCVVYFFIGTQFLKYTLFVPIQCKYSIGLVRLLLGVRLYLEKHKIMIKPIMTNKYIGKIMIPDEQSTIAMLFFISIGMQLKVLQSSI